MRSKNFKQDENVVAKWPGSNLYYPAKVVKVFEDDDIVQVIFDQDNSKMNIENKYVYKKESFKRMSSKSPGRRRSRSRSPSRKASPSRNKSPARNRPGVRIQRTDTDAKTSSSNEDVSFSKKKYLMEEKPTRRSGRLFEKTTTTTTTTYSKVISKTEQSTSSERTTSDIILEHIGVVVGFVMIALFPLLLLVTCNSKTCNIEYEPKKIYKMMPKNFDAYFDKTAAIILNGFLLFQAVIYSLPIGRVVEGPETPSKQKIFYRLNAFNSMVITVLAYALLVYLKYPTLLVNQKLFQITFLAAVEAVATSIIFYIMSFWAQKWKLSPEGNTGWFILDIFNGRELHPRIGKYFDLKMYLIQVGMIGMILLNLIYMQQEMESTKTIRPALLFVAVSQIIYSINSFFWEEDKAIFAYSIKDMGLGYFFICFPIMTPVFYTMQSRYILEHRTLAPLTDVMVGTIVAMCVSGISMIYLADSQKLAFRKNPYDPKLSGLESIPPSKKGGKRILVSGLWGFVRRPSYLGEIICSISWSLACGCDHYIAWLYPAFLIPLLMQRVVDDEKRCQQRHGYAWNEYCKRVPYRIFPYLF